MKHHIFKNLKLQIIEPEKEDVGYPTIVKSDGPITVSNSVMLYHPETKDDWVTALRHSPGWADQCPCWDEFTEQDWRDLLSSQISLHEYYKGHATHEKAERI